MGRGTDSAKATGRAARRATRANRRLEMEWILIPAIIAVVFVVGFGAKLLFG
jgi:hypothetical protein